jgi:hypothetical protein
MFFIDIISFGLLTINLQNAFEMFLIIRHGSYTNTKMAVFRLEIFHLTYCLKYVKRLQ